MLRKFMSSIMRCLSSNICFVIGELLSCELHMQPRQAYRAEAEAGGCALAAWGYVGELILCDASRRALLSHTPSFLLMRSGRDDALNLMVLLFLLPCAALHRPHVLGYC